MAVVFWLFLPKDHTPKASAELPGHVPPSGLLSCLKDKKFIGFAAFFSVNLLATNQFYFGLPVELERSGAGVASLALVFAYASIVTITLQWPITKLMRKAGPRTALPLGFALQSLGFASLGVLAINPPPGWLPILPSLVLVTGTALGNMCVCPWPWDWFWSSRQGAPRAHSIACWLAPEGWQRHWETQPSLPSTNSPTHHPSQPWLHGSCCQRPGDHGDIHPPIRPPEPPLGTNFRLTKVTQRLRDSRRRVRVQFPEALTGKLPRRVHTPCPGVGPEVLDAGVRRDRG